MSIRLIATDLDGTLLHEIWKVSPRGSEVIARAQKKGVLYAVATGRCLCQVPREQLPPVDYFILDNGAEVRDGKTDEVIYAAYIPEDAILAMMDVMADMPISFEFFIDGKATIDESMLKNNSIREYYKRMMQVDAVRVVPDLRRLIEVDHVPVTKINVLVKDPESYDEIGRRLRADARYELAAGSTWYELTHLGESKGPSLVRLCERLGIDLADVAAFGDSQNDVTMLQAVGYGVAMGNSMPEAKAAARYQTLSNKEDGVAVFLEEQLGL